ncbi:histidine phosphotransferase family protein [Luteithermobacter gelatinilyticus]|uniref:histidine phosphotransferase family protein n=1 Tax=Luteithermobacter gelatinilyticus TaxID=2582913 RepID=UPI0011057AF3|nr:histidine phosphotransferase family protein [Luteithermobacter gelatinilyticus]
MSDIEFAALLCSRLCHDLISPVGAIANGIEILSEEDDDMMRQEVMKLLEQSAGQTSNRLQFFRLAFGAAGGFGEEVPLDEAEKAVKALFSTSLVDVAWNVRVQMMNKDAIKLMLNLILLAGEALLRGGRLEVNVEEHGESRQIGITASGEKVIFQDKIRETLLGNVAPEGLEPKTAPAFLAKNVADKLGTEIQHTVSQEQSFALRFTLASSAKDSLPQVG